MLLTEPSPHLVISRTSNLVKENVYIDTSDATIQHNRAVGSSKQYIEETMIKAYNPLDEKFTLSKQSPY